ncbi:MAG TPA: hypothetical protein VGW78_07735 [Candidatus Babeliales bacterium]|jgi:hypothetical protein|nr:hypothetical protein [Candidatus Babeliales bacterium]
MATLYQKNMNILNPGVIDNVFDTVNKCFIPIDGRSPFYQNVLAYLKENNLTIDQLDVYA